MTPFYYNLHSGEDFYPQWMRYLQNNAYLEEQILTMQQYMDKQAAQLNSTLEMVSEEQADVMRESAGIICNVLTAGQEQLAQKLEPREDQEAKRVARAMERVGEIKEDFEELFELFDWRMSMLLEEQRIENLLTENIAQLLRIPESQKERQYNVEQGLRFFNNARFDEDLYEDALYFLLKAAKLNRTDYFVLHRIGMIYLYGSKEVDVAKAEAYFLKAAKYAIVESQPEAISLVNILESDVQDAVFSVKASREEVYEKVKLLAAEANFQAGICCYIQGKFADAAMLSEKAFALAPQMVEALYNQAKALCAGGEYQRAVTIVKSLLAKDRLYAIRLVADPDFSSKAPIRDVLSEIRDEAVAKAGKWLKQLKRIMVPGSEAQSFLEIIETLLQKNTFLDAQAAMDEFARKRQWTCACLKTYGVRKVATCTHLSESLCFSKSSQLLAVLCRHRSTEGQWEDTVSVHVWDLASFKEVAVFEERNCYSQLALSPDDALLALAMGNGYIKLYDIPSKQEVAMLAHGYECKALRFCQQGSLLASCDNKTVKIWDVKRSKELACFSNPNACYRDLEVDATGTFLAANCCEEARRWRVVWNARTLEEIASLADHKKAMGGLEFSSERLLLARDENEDLIKVFDVTRKKQVNAISYSKNAKIAFDVEANNLLWHNQKGLIEGYSIGEKKKLKPLEIDQKAIWDFCAHQNVVAVGQGQQVFLWDLNSREKIGYCFLIGDICSYGKYRTSDNSITFSPDGHTMVTRGETRKTELWFLQKKTASCHPTLTVKGFISFEAARHREIEEYEAQARTISRCEEEFQRTRIEAAVAEQARAEEADRERWKRAREAEARLVCQETYQKAYRQELAEDKKWFFKNYAGVMQLYAEAAQLGSEEAKERLELVRKKAGE